MASNFKIITSRQVSERMQRVLDSMTSAAMTPSKPYEVVGGANGYVILRPDLASAKAVVSLGTSADPQPAPPIQDAVL